MSASPNRVPPRIRHDERPLSQRGIRQPTLMDAPDKATLAFLDYHHRNPQIFASFRDMALRLWKHGVRHYGAKALWEALRYETTIRAHDEPLKLNNNYTSYYARLLMMQDQRFVDFFSIRHREPKGRRV